jgi:hypothetical protein
MPRLVPQPEIKHKITPIETPIASVLRRAREELTSTALKQMTTRQRVSYIGSLLRNEGFEDEAVRRAEADINTTTNPPPVTAAAPTTTTTPPTTASNKDYEKKVLDRANAFLDSIMENPQAFAIAFGLRKRVEDLKAVTGLPADKDKKNKKNEGVTAIAAFNFITREDAYFNIADAVYDMTRRLRRCERDTDDEAWKLHRSITLKLLDRIHTDVTDLTDWELLQGSVPTSQQAADKSRQRRADRADGIDHLDLDSPEEARVRVKMAASPAPTPITTTKTLDEQPVIGAADRQAAATDI